MDEELEERAQRPGWPLELALLIGLDFGLVALGCGYGWRALAAAVCVTLFPVKLRARASLSMRPVGRALGWTVGIALPIAVFVVSLPQLWRATLGAAGEPAALLVPSGHAFGPWFVWAVVLAPLVEEWIYRGVLQSTLRERVPQCGRIAGSALAFWLVHWVSYGGVTPVIHLVAGLVLAWSFERTRSLLTPVLLHALGNGGLWLHDWLLVQHPEVVRSWLG